MALEAAATLQSREFLPESRLPLLASATGCRSQVPGNCVGFEALPTKPKWSQHMSAPLHAQCHLHMHCKQAVQRSAPVPMQGTLLDQTFRR